MRQKVADKYCYAPAAPFEHSNCNT